MGCCGRGRRVVNASTTKTDSNEGRRVEITAGPHKGKKGRIVKKSRVGVYLVQLDGLNVPLEFYTNFLKFLD